MPKRTNDFQRLVYLVRVNLADGAKVTESKLLKDRISKGRREVDVCIEGHVGGHSVVISVECRDHKRIADVTWVDAMKAKHERLPTNVLILASRIGFTPEARRVADSFGIQTFSLTDVEEADFPTIFGSASSIWTKSVTLSVEKVLVNVLLIDALAAESVAVMPDNLVYSSDHKELGQIGEFVEAMLKSQRAREYFLLNGKEEHAWFELTWEPPRDHLDRPLFLKRLTPAIFREIASIQIKGPCKCQIDKFGMKRGKLGDVHVAWGKSAILGQDTLIVATKNNDGVAKLSVHFSGKP